ncbi:MAG: small basic protein [Planctomycetota bacterium]
MSIDPSLKSSGGMIAHRNVLTRPERIKKLQAEGKLAADKAVPLGLPKVGNRRISAGKKK